MFCLCSGISGRHGAVRLTGASSACAPIDRFTAFKFNRDGGFLNYFRFHRITPMRDGLRCAQLVTKYDSFITIEQNAVFLRADHRVVLNPIYGLLQAAERVEVETDVAMDTWIQALQELVDQGRGTRGIQ